MMNKVYILRIPNIQEEQKNSVTEENETGSEKQGSLKELNNLLDKGWLIKDTIDLGIKGKCHLIIYNLVSRETAKSSLH